ncbi:hypothetical protein GCM10025734_58010 [Kitasatospora paranensis]
MIDVLVVDDDFRVADVHAAYVAKIPGFRVTGTAHSAGEALALLERAPVDLVLLDHHLPDESGLALVRRLRDAGIACDVMMVTAARDVSTVHAAMQHGALQYLVKPFSFGGLRAKLTAYAELRHALAGPAAREACQDEVDRMFATLRTASSPTATLPKGTAHPPPTWCWARCAGPGGRSPPRRSRRRPACRARPHSATSSSWPGTAGCGSPCGTATPAAPNTGTCSPRAERRAPRPAATRGAPRHHSPRSTPRRVDRPWPAGCLRFRHLSGTHGGHSVTDMT